MSVLSDADIKREIEAKTLVIKPFDPKQLQPASYDVCLGPKFLVPMSGLGRPMSHDFAPVYKAVSANAYTLFPGEFILGRLAEHVTLPSNICAKIEGKSSLGRIGLSIHVTAGFVDPGWDGILTIEMKVEAITYPINIQVGMKIAQLRFEYLQTPSEKPYCGRYQGSTDVQGFKGLKVVE